MSKGYGPLRIRAELRRRGVAEELIAGELESDPEVWLERLRTGPALLLDGATGTLQVGDVVLDVPTRTVTADGMLIALTRLEFDLVRLLIRADRPAPKLEPHPDDRRTPKSVVRNARRAS